MQDFCQVNVESSFLPLSSGLRSVTDFHHGPKSVLIVIFIFIDSIIDVIIVMIITIMLFVRTRLGCSFSSWSPKETRCRLYDEPLARFIGLAQKYTKYKNTVIFSNCLLHGGPKGLGGCPVDQPAESSCEGVRF